jgi:hypothetical protein
MGSYRRFKLRAWTFNVGFFKPFKSLSPQEKSNRLNVSCNNIHTNFDSKRRDGSAAPQSFDETCILSLRSYRESFK